MSWAARTADRAVDVLVVAARALRPLAPVWAWLAARLGIRRDVLTVPSTAGMRRLAVAGLVANGFIVVSGGLVRLTKSGLGCPTWPRCTPDSLLPAPHADVPAMQMAIEFGNRMVTFLVMAIGVLVLVAAVHLRASRPDLARLAVVQPLGVLGQGVLGGVTVLSGLHPAVVGAHYLLSAVLLVACTALVARTAEGDGPPAAVAGPRTTLAVRALPYAGLLLLVAGTVVTGAGPHAGDEEAERYGFLGAETVTVATRVHSVAMWATLGLVVAVLALLAREPAPDPDGVRRLRARVLVLVGVIAAQGLVGYVQYLTGVPAWLVLLHIAGSVLFWVTVLRVRLAARTRGTTPLPSASRTPRVLQR